MKFALILILILGVLPFTQAVDGTCAGHPQVAQISDLIGSLKGEMDGVEHGNLLTAFDAYKESNGTNVWDWDTNLGDNQCSGFGNGNPSCCTNDLVKHFKAIFKGTVTKGKKEEKPTQKEFLKHFSMQLGKCKGKPAVETFLGLPGITTFLNGIKTCRENAFKTGVNFIRRNLCTLCFTGAEMTSNFDNGKLKVTQASFDEYDTALQGTFSCVENLNSGLFTTVQTHYNSLEFEDNDTIACDRFADWIYNIIELGADTIKPTAPAAGACKGKAKMFGKGCEEDLQEGGFEAGGDKGPKKADGTGGAQGEGVPPKQPETEGTKGEEVGTKGEEGIKTSPQPKENNRMLTSDDSEFTVDASGYEVFIDESAALDGTIVTSSFTETETIDIDTSTITVEQDPVDTPLVDDDSSRLSMFISALVLIVGSIL